LRPELLGRVSDRARKVYNASPDLAAPYRGRFAGKIKGTQKEWKEGRQEKLKEGKEREEKIPSFNLPLRNKIMVTALQDNTSTLLMLLS